MKTRSGKEGVRMKMIKGMRITQESRDKTGGWVVGMKRR